MKHQGKTLLSKAERTALFLKRLKQARKASTFDEAYTLLCDTLNKVEDEHSGVPYNIEQWRTDGRMYPPQMDNARPLEDYPGMTRFRTLAHHVFISDKGAILIYNRRSESIDLSKSGKDGSPIPESVLK